MLEQMVEREPNMVGVCINLVEDKTTGGKIICGAPVMELLGDIIFLESGATETSIIGFSCHVCQEIPQTLVNFFRTR